MQYTWAFEGVSQEGFILMGCKDKAAVMEATFVDSFHMSARFMHCEGKATPKALSFTGSYPAPQGPDWHWRITLRSSAPGRLEMVMCNISPEGVEHLAVKALLRRK